MSDAIVRDTTRLVNRGTGGFLSRPSTLLGALGLAWGIFETLQNQVHQVPRVPQVPEASVLRRHRCCTSPRFSGCTGAEVPVPPIPNVSAPAPLSPDAMRMMRLAVSAAHADGPMNDQERAAILLQAKQAGVESVFGPEMAQPRPLAEIVVGVTEPPNGPRSTSLPTRCCAPTNR